MPPRLAIPVGLNLDGLGQEFGKLDNRVGIGLRAVERTFQVTNAVIVDAGKRAAASYAADFGGASLKIASNVNVLKFAFAGLAAVTVGVLNEARKQLVEMVEIAEKAGRSNVTAEFFQRFISGAKEGKVGAEEFERALTNAFEATKEKLDQVNPALRKLEEFFLAGVLSDTDKRSGLDLFRNARNQDEKIRALVVAMTELEAAGRKLEALDLGEAVFGKELVDRIRTGKLSFDEILSNLDRASAKFRDSLVREAAEVDRQLQKANDQLRNAMTPALEGIAGKLLEIKRLWIDIVELAARAVAAMNAATGASRSQQISSLQTEIANINKELESGGKTNTGGMFSNLAVRMGLLSGDRSGALTSRRDDLQKRLDALLPDQPGPGVAAPGTPLPRERPTGIGTNSVEENISAYERMAESIQKSIALTNAEAQAIGLTAGERAKLRAEAVLYDAVARDGTVVTEEMRAKIEALGTAAQQSADALASRRADFEQFNSTMRFAGSQLVDIFDAIGDKSKSMADVVRGSLQQVKRSLLELLITGGGPFGRPSATGGPGGLLALFASFGGARAGGGDARPGRAYKVNENTPNSEWFVPGVSGQIVPDKVMRGTSRSSGGVSVAVTNAPTYQAGMTPTDMASIDAKMAQNNVELESKILQNLRKGLSLDSGYLGQNA